MATTRWVGYVQGTNRGKIFVRMKSSNEALTGDIVFKDIAYGTAVAKIKGRLSNSQITADLFDFAFAKHFPLVPQTGQISMTISEDNSEVSGAWATDIGTHGQCRLFKINFLKAFSVTLPSLYRVFLRIKQWFKANLKYLYLFFTLLITIASLTGLLKDKIGINETIILIIPLLFLFKTEIRDFFLITRLKKIGPVEVQEQPVTPAGINMQRILDRLFQDYGNSLPLFFYLNRFFVPRTKAILQILAVYPSFQRQQFDSNARVLGIEENNIQITYDVLVQNGCLKVESDGGICVTDFGRRFLEFENRLNQIIFLQSR